MFSLDFRAGSRRPGNGRNRSNYRIVSWLALLEKWQPVATHGGATLLATHWLTRIRIAMDANGHRLDRI